MKYIILIHSNEHSLKLWETLTEQQRMDFGRGHLKLTEEMAEAGVLVVSEGLADPALARWVSARDGEIIASDGPFAEVKEHLAGFYLIRALPAVVAASDRHPGVGRQGAGRRGEVRPSRSSAHRTSLSRRQGDECLAMALVLGT